MSQRFRNYLPSKHFMKVTLFSALLVIAVGGTVKLISRAQERKQLATGQADQQNAQQAGSLISISDLTEKDTDSDGVPDWEEALWGTDPTKTDTNGDGISDKEEINQKKAALEKKNPSTSTDTNLTDTQTFSHELFASIAALKQSGNLNNQSIQDLAQTISLNAGDKQTITDFYTTSDMKTSSDTAQAIATYQKTMVAVLAKYDTSGIRTELSIIDDSLSADNKDKLGGLHAIAKAYEDLAKDIIAVPAPPGIATNHLSLANSANNTGIALENTTAVYDNAISGLIGISQYQNQSGTFEQTLTDIHDYFVKNGIIQ